MSAHYLCLVLRAIALIMWTPMIAFAKLIEMEQAIGGVTATVVLLVSSVSVLAGLTALIFRVERQLRLTPGVGLPKPFLFISGQMIGAQAAGWLALAVAESTNAISGWGEIAFIGIASFLGAKFIEFIAEKTIPGMPHKTKDSP